jgi:hypothetical protein
MCNKYSEFKEEQVAEKNCGEDAPIIFPSHLLLIKFV